MKALFVKQPDLGWIEARARCTLSKSARGLLAVDASNRIRGAVAWDNWAPNSCEMHQAFESPMAMRCLLPEAFVYPFEKCGRRIIFGHTPSNNLRALESAEAFGFTVAGMLEDAWAPGVDMVITQLKRDDCRFLKSLRGREAA